MALYGPYNLGNTPLRALFNTDLLKRGACGHNRPAVGPLIRLCRRALGLRCGVRHRHHDRRLVHFCHVPDHFLGE
eukprot:scaffold137014_cov31-Tisochrysis_lutea.AAC.5